MDVALGVAVTDRVARLALVDSAAPGTVIDQFVLDVAEHPVEVLTETVVGTDRSLAGENHRLVATRLCWPDQAKADELQHALQDSGVHDVAVISEAQAATALVGAAHAGSAVLLVGDETATLSVVGDPDAPPNDGGRRAGGGRRRHIDRRYPDGPARRPGPRPGGCLPGG